MVGILEKKRQFLIENISDASWELSISMFESGGKPIVLHKALPFCFISYLSASAMEIIDAFLGRRKGW